MYLGSFALNLPVQKTAAESVWAQTTRDFKTSRMPLNSSDQEKRSIKYQILPFVISNVDVMKFRLRSVSSGW